MALKCLCSFQINSSRFHLKRSLEIKLIKLEYMEIIYAVGHTGWWTNQEPFINELKVLCHGWGHRSDSQAAPMGQTKVVDLDVCSFSKEYQTFHS